MIAATKIDAFGFPESASALGDKIIDAANRVGFAVQRSAALLRSLNFQLLNASHDKVSMSDVMALVELALQTLPDSEGDFFNDFDQCGIAVSQAFQAARTHQQTVSALLDAMEVAACMGSTLDELDKAANTAFGIATAMPDGQRHWDAFCELIVRRGLSIEVINLGNGLLTYPKVNTLETRKHSKAVQRKTAAFVAAVHEEATARAPKRKPAKRRQGKA